MHFSECCIEYTDGWLENCKQLLDFDWVNLNECPTWDNVNRTAHYLIEKGLFSEDKHQTLFNRFDYLKNYCTEEKIKEWKKTSVEERWVDFFTYMNDVCECESIELLVSYALTIPGNFYILFWFDSNI